MPDSLDNVCPFAGAATAANGDVARFALFWARVGEPACTCGRCTWPAEGGRRVPATSETVREDLQRRGLRGEPSPAPAAEGLDAEGDFRPAGWHRITDGIDLGGRRLYLDGRPLDNGTEVEVLLPGGEALAVRLEGMPDRPRAHVALGGAWETDDERADGVIHARPELVAPLPPGTLLRWPARRTRPQPSTELLRAAARLRAEARLVRQQASDVRRNKGVGDAYLDDLAARLDLEAVAIERIASVERGR